MENLLTRIATTVGSRQAENIATSALVYVLQRYDTARVAFIAHLRAASGLDLSDDLTFVGQVDRSSLGVTDISGLRGGTEEVIVEAKISAGLHGDQIRRYLRRLEGTAAVLLLLAPRARLPYLWHEVCRALDLGSRQTRATVDDVTITATTWEATIQALANAVGEQSDGGAELRQIAGLYSHIERAAFIPLSDDDVSHANGRAVHSMAALVLRVLDHFRLGYDSHVRFTSTLRGADWGFGRNGRVGPLPAWCGMWLPQWAQLAPTPMWLQFKRLAPATASHVAAVIEGATADADSRPACFTRGSDEIVVPLYIPLGVSEDTTVQSIVRRVRALGSALASTDIEVAPADEQLDDDPAAP